MSISNDVKWTVEFDYEILIEFLIQLIISKAAEHFGVQVSSHEMFREVYAYYTKIYAGPDGNMGTAFYVSAVDEEPVLNGVTIPRSSGYTVRKEVELDLSMCSVQQFHGILGKPFSFLVGNSAIRISWSSKKKKPSILDCFWQSRQKQPLHSYFSFIVLRISTYA